MNQQPGNSQPITEPSVIRTNRPRMAVFGEWNTTNLGDRAIFEGVQAFCQNAGWDVDAYGLGTLTPIALASLADRPLSAWNRAPNASRQPFPFLKQRGSLSNRLYQHAKRNVRGVRQHYRMKRLLPRLSQANAILVGGGSLLSDRQLHFPQSLLEIAQASKTLRLPLLCLGCGALEAWTPKGRAMIAQFAEACTLIAARDQETAGRLASVLSRPVPVFGDFALTIPVAHQVGDRQPVLAINVMQLIDQRNGYQTQYETALIEVANRWLKQLKPQQQGTVKLFTTGTCEDIRPAERVAEQIAAQPICVFRPTSVEGLNHFLQQSTAVLASRLHAAILAISQGTPVIGLGAGHVSLKLDTFFESLGLSDYSVSVLDENAVQRTLEILNRQTLQTQTSHIDLLELFQARTQANTVLNHLAFQTN